MKRPAVDAQAAGLEAMDTEMFWQTVGRVQLPWGGADWRVRWTVRRAVRWMVMDQVLPPPANPLPLRGIK